MHLLVCLDESDVSKAILPEAARIADAGAFDVSLLHVRDVTRVHALHKHADGGDVALPGRLGARDRQIVRETIDDRDAALGRAEATARDTLDAALTHLAHGGACTVVHGADAAAEIIRYAREHDIGLIAMSAHSRHGISRLVWASTTQALIDSGVAPVMVVRPL